MVMPLASSESACKSRSSLPKVSAWIEAMARFTAFAPIYDSYGTKYGSYIVPVAMKTVSLLALFGDEFTNPYITVN
jgi:hypothetical protein